jgi:hypothetical protein
MPPDAPSRPSSPSSTLGPELLYREMCSSHDRIADFRAKLLALLPIASGAGLFLLLEADTTASAHLGPIGLFGFAVTLGLFLYELRGMDECLLSRCRAANLEDAARIPYYQARFLKNPSRFIGPQGAAWVIYPRCLPRGCTPRSSDGAGYPSRRSRSYTSSLPQGDTGCGGRS